MEKNYEIETDFYLDWINHLKEELRKMEYTIEASETAAAVSLKYFNILWRSIPVKPRKVLLSKEFTCPSEHQSGLDILTSRIERGENLLPHLSTKVLFNPGDNDNLLNDWGIYHLHLGVSPHRKYNSFVERTRPLLFARFDQEFAYLINIFDHGNWTNEHLIQILHDNWQDSVKQFRIPGIDLEEPIENRGDFRESGVLAPIQLANGVVYMALGGGYTISGTSIRVVMASDDHATKVRQFEEHIRNNLCGLILQAESNGFEFEAKLHFRLIINDSRFYVVEENSKACWCLN